MRTFLKNVNHVAEAMIEKDLKIAELEFVELTISFHEWKIQQKKMQQLERLTSFVAEMRKQGVNITFLKNKKGSAPTLPMKQAIKHYTSL